MNQVSKKHRKEYIGQVASVAMPKTIVVVVEHIYHHPLYKKAVKKTRRFSVHNEAVNVHVGDIVRIEESQPLSKTKHFIVTGKLAK